ncbi:Ribosomal L1 domain-containing protein 1 [Ophiophagus hannah]|uniref:Ribosomal L1 domain-containing protein 1 n=1 Tax=Ophiophagus hannah TaxID=8665 RepID=V8N9F8_OPHHA|nr:Ribosomal L1 domain-containing protein 1 [Ophiophagus hannah]
MEAKVEAAALPLDQSQIKKATQALLAYNAKKQESGDKVLLDVDQNVFLMITVWKIPPNEQVCLFTKDEPGLTAEQTENLYKKLLDRHGITSITEPFEAKRRLLSRFALFLSDDRIRRLLPSQMGKHFYLRKKVPLSVDLKAKDLAKEINKRIRGTIWKSVKVLHLKTSKSIALPVFHSALQGQAGAQKKKGAEHQQTLQRKKKKSKAKPKTTDQTGTKGDTSGVPEAGVPKTDRVEPPALTSKEEEEEEEIPQLVLIETQPSEEKEQPETASPKLRSKRKAGLSPEIPVSQPETPGEASALEKSNQRRSARKPKVPKQEFLEKTQNKDAQQPLAKPTVAPKRLKTPKSDKKPKTPKRELRKMKVPLSL